MPELPSTTQSASGAGSVAAGRQGHHWRKADPQPQRRVRRVCVWGMRVEFYGERPIRESRTLGPGPTPIPEPNAHSGMRCKIHLEIIKGSL